MSDGKGNPGDAAAADAGPDVPGAKELCEQRAGVPLCEPGPAPTMKVTTAPGSPLIESLKIASNSRCRVEPCLSPADAAAGCASFALVGGGDFPAAPGLTCDFLIRSVDQQTAFYSEKFVVKYRMDDCCGYPLAPNKGVWITREKVAFQTEALVVNFSRDAAADN